MKQPVLVLEQFCMFVCVKRSSDRCILVYGTLSWWRVDSQISLYACDRAISICNKRFPEYTFKERCCDPKFKVCSEIDGGWNSFIHLKGSNEGVVIQR